MAYIYCWHLEEEDFFKSFSEYLNYNFEEFHSLWFDSSKMTKGYSKLKELIDNGEEVYGLYFGNSIENPIAISKLVGIYNEIEYEHYKEKASKSVKKVLDEREPSSIVWFEKNFRFVENIQNYIKPYNNYRNLYVFEKEKYEMFLKTKNIESEFITKENIVNRLKHMQDVFISTEEKNKIDKNLIRKHNIIIQGPPGVGKTYTIKKLVENNLGITNSKRFQMIQFHQSYSYEDFIQGFKPNGEGGFELRNGVFYEFCQNAKKRPSHSYYFVIDEINRGNLSKIFGELLMLIENDKRGPQHAIPLTYSKSGETFYVPENVYIIGLMNTADRSLAVVDYAFRRRFSFIKLKPCFDNNFIEFLKRKKISENFIYEIINKITALNKTIELDPNLGHGFLIGHSYFCPSVEVESKNEADWYNDIIENEIAPTLEEYWYDDLLIAEDEIAKLFSK